MSGRCSIIRLKHPMKHIGNRSLTKIIALPSISFFMSGSYDVFTLIKETLQMYLNGGEGV